MDFAHLKHIYNNLNLKFSSTPMLKNRLLGKCLSLNVHITDAPALDHYIRINEMGIQLEQGCDHTLHPLKTKCDELLSFLQGKSMVSLDAWEIEPYPGEPAALRFQSCSDVISLLYFLLDSPFILDRPHEEYRLALIDAAKRLPSEARTQSPPRLPVTEKEVFIKDFIQTGRPVILTGKYKPWTWNKIISTGPREIILPTSTSGGMITYSLASLIARLKDLNAFYYRFYFPLAGSCDAFGLWKQECSLIDIFSEEKHFLQSSSWIFSNPQGNGTVWHSDFADNIFYQMIGSKNFQICSPEFVDCFYVHEGPALFNNVPVDISDVNPVRPDLTTHPRFAKAKVLECVIEEGEILYLPAGWYHNVFQLTASASINQWLYPLANALRLFRN